MGKPPLTWSPIQLLLANQQRIVPLGSFLSVQTDIAGFSTIVDFEVIEIIDDSDPYPALLGIEWAMENAAVINLKKRQMIFEGRDLRVILPLDPSQGERYTEPLRQKDQDDVEPIYTITVQDGGYEDPPTTGWESGNSCMTNSEDDLEIWQNRLYELHGHSSTRPTKSLRWLSSQPSPLTTFDGSTDPDPFIVQF